MVTYMVRISVRYNPKTRYKAHIHRVVANKEMGTVWKPVCVYVCGQHHLCCFACLTAPSTRGANAAPRAGAVAKAGMASGSEEPAGLKSVEDQVEEEGENARNLLSW